MANDSENATKIEQERPPVKTVIVKLAVSCVLAALFFSPIGGLRGYNSWTNKKDHLCDAVFCFQEATKVHSEKTLKGKRAKNHLCLHHYEKTRDDAKVTKYIRLLISFPLGLLIIIASVLVIVCVVYLPFLFWNLVLNLFNRGDPVKGSRLPLALGCVNVLPWLLFLFHGSFFL